MPTRNLTLLVLFPRHCGFFLWSQKLQMEVSLCLVWVLTVVISDLKVGNGSLQLEVINTKSWLSEILLTSCWSPFLLFYELLVRKYHCRYSCRFPQGDSGGKTHKYIHYYSNSYLDKIPNRYPQVLLCVFSKQN